ncbi:MAG: hypothetical protein ACKOWG_02270 [Planctomycetia bacterium]
MHKKTIFSRSRAYRLWMERLEKRSMLAADVDAGFEDFSFDWSQFDWSDFDWSQFDDSAWSDPAADSSTVGGVFVDPPPEDDPSWVFEQVGADPAPAEPEAPLPEAAVDDPVATTEDSWQTTVVEMTDSTGIDSPIVTDPIVTDPIVTDPIVDDTTADPEIDVVTPVEPPVVEDPVAETVTDLPLPVEPEPTPVESPLDSGSSNPEAGIDDWEWDVQDDTSDWDNWTDGADASDGADVAELEAGVLDESEPQAGEEPLPEDVVSFDNPDVPVQTAVPSANAAAPRQAGFSARAAAFGAMRMFPGFSFGGSNDSGDDGPIFAGGRRRSRR